MLFSHWTSGFRWLFLSFWCKKTSFASLLEHCFWKCSLYTDKQLLDHEQRKSGFRNVVCVAINTKGCQKNINFSVVYPVIKTLAVKWWVFLSIIHYTYFVPVLQIRVTCVRRLKPFCLSLISNYSFSVPFILQSSAEFHSIFVICSCYLQQSFNWF